MDIEWIRQQVRSGIYEFSGHAEDERQAEKISLAEVEVALLNGEILEDYPNDPRSQSCLVLGQGESTISNPYCLRPNPFRETETHYRVYSLSASVD